MAVRNKTRIRDGNGVAPVMNAAAAGDQILEPGPDCVLLVRNGSGASINVTIVTPGNLPNGDAYPDKVVAVPATSDKFIAVGTEYADSTNLASVNWSATATVTWAPLSTA